MLQDDHFAYLVMEHMSGGDLFQLLVKGRFHRRCAEKTGVGEEDAKMIQAVSIDPHCNTIATNSHFGGEVSSGGSGGLPLPLAKFYVAEVSYGASIPPPAQLHLPRFETRKRVNRPFWSL